MVSTKREIGEERLRGAIQKKGGEILKKVRCLHGINYSKTKRKQRRYQIPLFMCDIFEAHILNIHPSDMIRARCHRICSPTDVP